MDTKTTIRHKGFVKEVSGNKLTVNIINQSACSSCHAKGACTVADFQEKEIEIDFFSGEYKAGQEVTVLFHESQGFRALLFGYVLPFILVFVTLVIAVTVSGDELLGGMLSLGILIPYFITLFFFRKYLKKVFKFEVEETN